MWVGLGALSCNLTKSSSLGMSFVFESNPCSTRTSAVRSFAELRTIWAVRAKFVWRVTAHNSLRHRSALLADDWPSMHYDPHAWPITAPSEQRALIVKSQGDFGHLWLRGFSTRPTLYKAACTAALCSVCSGVLRDRERERQCHLI